MRIDKHQGELLSHHWKVNNQEKDKLLEQLATGKQINRASDDAAGMAMAREFEKQVRAYRSAAENISDGMGALSIADGGSSSIGDMLQRQRELAVQSANGAINDDQRHALDNEFQSLSQEIDRISKSTDFNGQHLLDGSGALAGGGGHIQAGDGTGDSVDMPTSDISLGALNLTSENLTSSDGALKAMNAIDSAMRKVNDTRSTQGGLQNRLEIAAANVGNQIIQSTRGLSNIEDVDFAQAISQKVRTDVLQNTGAAAISQFNQLSRTNLLALFQ
jgi:flagellin